MSLKNTACIAGAWEHPTRRADDKSVAQLHAEVARGALFLASDDSSYVTVRRIRVASRMILT